MTPTSPTAIVPEILGDLKPVRRLARPWKRTLAVCVLAALAGLVVFVWFGVRADAAEVGRAVLWGLSLFQACYGLVLVAFALRTSVPGRDLPRGLAAGLLLAGALLVLAVTFATWSAHASRVAAGMEWRYWVVCTRTPVAVGLPVLLLALLLAFRAYPTRPLLTGGLAGLGAGLLSDGSWRTFCEVSDPAHVLSSHAASVALLTLAGVVLAWAWSRWSLSRRDHAQR